jgi:hypothetical protein
MKTLCWISVFVLVIPLKAIAITSGFKQQSKEIPLDEIWAYEMPGTLDVRALEPDKFGVMVRNLGSEEQVKRSKESLTFQIMKSIGVAKRGLRAAPGFAVLGSGEGALRNAHAVLVDRQKPRETFLTNSKITLVFFSKVFGYYVHLDKVEQRGTKITLKYSFVPHRETIGSSHFALIPLGELAAGEWNVEIEPSPWPETPEFAAYRAPGTEWNSSIVCRSFSFVVEHPVAK